MAMTLMEAEAAEAPAVARRQMDGLSEPIRALGRALRARDTGLVVTCARGSSDHAATYAKYLIETALGIPVASFAPSTASIYRTDWRRLKGALFLAISQSGRSPDLLLSAEAARRGGALVVALVNDEGSPLAEAADVVIPMLAGPERSVAATKSFIASLLIVARLAAEWGEDPALAEAIEGAPDMLERAWALDWSAALPVLAGTDSLYVLGRGLTLGAAQEAALKAKETCAIHAEAHSAAEVKHGPMAIVGPKLPVLMLVPAGAPGALFGPLARDFGGRGAKVMMAGGDEPSTLALPVLPGLDPAMAPIASILSFYRLAAAVSLARGLDPDRPPALHKVTETR